MRLRSLGARIALDVMARLVAMASITLKGNPIQTVGTLPSTGSTAPDFRLVRQDLSEATLATFSGSKILSLFPSIDTPVCAASVKEFNKKGAESATVINISADLPFAFKRFCGAEGLENVEALSSYRDPEFGDKYGVRMKDGPLAGLFARAIVVLNGDNKVVYTELVPEIAQEPDYASALAALS